MASEKKDTGGVLKDQNVFIRICNLQSVSCALESIEKTYISTKESHPIISSVCGLYEKGVSRAGGLAVWSMKPALHVLEPQLVVANSMACKGLDRLEEKLPALQSPPEELAANIKELMSSTLETAKDGITSPIKNTSSAVLDKVSSGYQQSKNVLNEGIQYVMNSKIVCLAEQRVESALSLTENLVGYILPASSTETEDDGSPGQPEPDAGASGPKPIFSRLEALADTICRRAIEKTAIPLQGQPLGTHIPGLSPLVEYTMGTMKTIGNTILGLPCSVATFLKDEQEQSPQKEKTDNEQEKPESNELPRLISRLGLKIYASLVDNIKKTPQTGFNLAKDGVNIVLTSFGTVREKALDKLSYYGLISRQSSQPEGVSQSAEIDEAEEFQGGSPVLESNVGDLIHSPSDNSEKQPLKVSEPKVSEISEETHQLKKKAVKQIPMQQKVVIEESNKKVSNHESLKKSLTDDTSSTSTLNANPTAE